MPLPKPRTGEERRKFVSRCISFAVGDGLPQEQAIAACHDIWRRAKGITRRGGENVADWQRFEFLVPINESITKGKDFIIRGVAINETTTRNGVRYVGEELEKAAASLRNKPILKDHNNSVDSIVGKTTENVAFNDEAKRIDFEAKIIDKSVQEKIKLGLISNVSIGATVREFEEQEEEGSAPIARGIDFLELSLVAVPGDPGAGITQALTESFKLKKRTEELEVCEDLGKESEEEKMDEKTTVEDLKSQKEKLEKEVLALQVAKLEHEKEQLKIKEEVEEAEEPKPEAKAEAEPVKDETKGEVDKPKAEGDTKEESYTVERSDLGGWAYTTDAIYEKSVRMRRA